MTACHICICYLVHNLASTLRVKSLQKVTAKLTGPDSTLGPCYIVECTVLSLFRALDSLLKLSAMEKFSSLNYSVYTSCHIVSPQLSICFRQVLLPSVAFPLCSFVITSCLQCALAGSEALHMWMWFPNDKICHVSQLADQTGELRSS